MVFVMFCKDKIVLDKKFMIGTFINFSGQARDIFYERVIQGITLPGTWTNIVNIVYKYKESQKAFTVE